MGEIIASLILAAGPEFAMTLIGILIILCSGINIPGKISLSNYVRNLLQLIGFVILLTGLYFMLLKIGFDALIEVPKLYTRENLIIFLILLIIGIIAYYLINKKRYSIIVTDFSDDEQVYINVINDGKAEIVCVAYLENFEKFGRGKKAEKIITPSNIFLWRSNTPRIELIKMGEGRFWVLSEHSNEMCLMLGGSDNLPIEYGKKYAVSIGIYCLRGKNRKHLMETINGEFCVKITNVSYSNTHSYKIDWRQNDEK